MIQHDTEAFKEEDKGGVIQHDKSYALP